MRNMKGRDAPMGWYYGFRFKPYVSVAERRAQAAREFAKRTKKGQKLSPVRIEGRTIAATFWGRAWCENLESYSDFANRLPRVPFPVVVETSLDDRLDEARREVLLTLLERRGLTDPSRVIVAFPIAEGMYALEAPRIALFYSFGGFGGGGLGGLGGFGGFGGFGGGGFGGGGFLGF